MVDVPNLGLALVLVTEALPQETPLFCGGNDDTSDINTGSNASRGGAADSVYIFTLVVSVFCSRFSTPSCRPTSARFHKPDCLQLTHRRNLYFLHVSVLSAQRLVPTTFKRITVRRYNVTRLAKTRRDGVNNRKM